MNSCSSSKTLSNKTKQAFFILPKNAIIVIKDQNMCNTTETALVYLLLTSIIERIPKQDKLSSWPLWNLPPSPQVVSEATTYLGWENYVCVCVRGENSHTKRTNTLFHRAAPATYLCCITHATAYPCTSRSAQHPAENGDSSPKISFTVRVLICQPENSIQDWGAGLLMPNDPCECADTKTPDFSRVEFLKTWHLNIHQCRSDQMICFQSPLKVES